MANTQNGIVELFSAARERYSDYLSESLYFKDTRAKDFIDNYIMEMFFPVNKEDENKNLVFLSYSEMSCFSVCRQKWQYEYVERLKKKVDIHYFFIGSLCHSCLEFLYSMKALGLTLSRRSLLGFFNFIANIGIDRNKKLFPEHFIERVIYV